MSDRDSPPGRTLVTMGLDLDAAAEQLRELDSGAAALRAIGVDLDQVRHRAEQAFGSGALEQPVRRRRGVLRRYVVTDGHIPFSQSAKRALQQALREAVELGDNHIGAEHLLLGLLHRVDDPGTRLLVQLGIDPIEVRTRVVRETRRVA